MTDTPDPWLLGLLERLPTIPDGLARQVLADPALRARTGLVARIARQHELAPDLLDDLCTDDRAPVRAAVLARADVDDSTATRLLGAGAAVGSCAQPNG